MNIDLVAVDPTSSIHLAYLYTLLGEREPHQSISHKEMPPFDQHAAFVESNPYKAWYLIAERGTTTFVGATYLTRNNEIGIGIFRSYRKRGAAKAAIKALMVKHDGPFLANINPNNSPSLALFNELGFDFLQATLSHE